MTPGRAVLAGAVFGLLALGLLLVLYRPTVRVPEFRNEVPPASPLAPVPMPDRPLVAVP